MPLLSDPTRFFASTILEGVRSVEAHLSTQSCASLDNLLSFAVAGKAKAKPDQAALVLFDLILSQSAIFYEVCGALNWHPLTSSAQMMRDLLNMVIFEVCCHPLPLHH